MVSKVSDITVKDIADYLRIVELDDTDTKELTTFISVAKNYCSSYTGIPIESADGESLDDIPDMVIVIYILCQDMYDNRTMYVEGKVNPNKVVQTILDMHTRNNL